MAKKKLVIEAGSIAEKNMSGVGHTTLYLIKALAADAVFTSKYSITLIVPFNKVHYVDVHGLNPDIVIKKLYLPGKIMNGIVRLKMVPYMDIFFGKGIYFFPNFKNWPLLYSKNITYIHDVYFKVKPEHIEERNLSMLKANVHRFIKRATVVIGVSRHAKSEIERFFPEAVGKSDFVYNGVDTDLFYHRDFKEQRRVAQKYGVQPEQYFLFFSNIEPRKNVAALIDSYERYCQAINSKDTALLLVGGMGWGNEEVLKRITELQKEGYAIIRPSMYVPDKDMPALISGAKALVHPALYEGFGLTPLEAMACSTPIIIGNNSSLPEIVGEEYDNYVDVKNIDDITEALIHIDNYPQKLIDSGLNRAKRFSWKKSAEKLAKIIRTLE